MTRRLNGPNHPTINAAVTDATDVSDVDLSRSYDTDLPDFQPPPSRQLYIRPLTEEDHIEISKISKGNIFRRLNSSLELSEYGLPDYLYRSDLIPTDLFYRTPEVRNELLTSSIIPITWDHGYPATDDATPLWEQLPGEPREAYDVYLKYLELPQASNSNNPVRMLPLLAQATGISYEQLSEYSHMYYWRFRFRAYDLFLIVCHQKQREQRIMSIEGRHYSLAEKYLNKVDKILEARLEHDIQELVGGGDDGESSIHYDLKLKDLVDIVQKLTTIQRVSVGLPANGNDQSERALLGAKNQTVDDSFREIASHATPAKRANARPASMDALLADPKALEMAQQLILQADK